MNDDLKFNNIPSAELEQLANVPDNTGEAKSLSTSPAASVQNSTATQHQSQLNESNPPLVKSEPQSPQNTSFNGNPPRTNTLRNKYRNGYQQSNSNGEASAGANQAYQNTAPTTSYPRTNTLRNKYKNGYPQNTDYNTSYPQNGCQYPPNTMPNNPYPRTNTLRNRSSGNYYSGAYPQNGYQPPYNSTPNNPYPRANSYYPSNANGYGYPYRQGYGGYPPYGQPNGYAYPQQYTPPAPPYYYQPDPKELERLQLSKDCSRAGVTTITIFIVMFVVAIIIEIIAVFCGVSRDLPDMVNDPYAGFTPMGFYMYEGLTSLLSIFIPCLIIIKGSGKKLYQVLPFKKIEGKLLASIVMCGMSLCMVAQLMSTLIGINFSLFGIDIYEGLETAAATGILDLIMSTICTAVIPALVEEFAYRGLVVGILKDHDEMLAIFGSAFLFGMLHGNFAQIPFAFVVGLILGYVRVKTDSMLPGILIHFGNNFYAVVITILSEVLPEPYATLVDVAVILVLIVIGFIATNYLVKNYKDFFKIKSKKTYLTYKEKLNTFLKTGTVIASIVILTIMSFVVLLAV